MYSFRNSLLIISTFLVFLFGLPSGSRAQEAPPSPSQACEIIHVYESYCRYLAPEPCARYRSGSDFSSNSPQRAAWEAYFHLCGEDPNRDSRACIAFLGIGDSCEPSAPAPLPPVDAYHHEESLSPAPLASKPYEAFHAPATLCTLSDDQYQVIERFHQRCGHATAAQCPQADETDDDFAKVCGDKSACACVQAQGCGDTFCDSTEPPPAILPSRGIGSGGRVIPPVSHEVVDPAKEAEGLPELQANEEGSAGQAPTSAAGDEPTATVGSGPSPVAGFALTGSGCSLQREANSLGGVGYDALFYLLLSSWLGVRVFRRPFFPAP